MPTKLRGSPVWTVIGLTTVSLVVHGLVLGLPVPDPPQPEPVPSSTSSKHTPTVDVAILPTAATAPDAAASPEDTELPKPDVANAEQPLLNVERSPQPTSPFPITPPAEPPSAITTSPSPLPDSVPPTSTESVPNPQTELPPEPGSGAITDSPPTLAEQLQDPSAYQYDNRKSLDPATAAVESLNWVAPGQVLPSKVAPLELPYQLGDACLDSPPMIGLIMAVVDAEGTFIRGPEIISSTGYPILDEHAVAQVSNDVYSLPRREVPTAYSIEVNVQYPNSCL